MLRLLLVVILTSLLGSGGVAAGLAADVPAIVEFAFIACLGLFVVALATGALRSTDRASPRNSIPGVPPDADSPRSNARTPHLESPQQAPVGVAE